MTSTRSLRSTVLGLILVLLVSPCRSRPSQSPPNLQRWGGTEHKLPGSLATALSLQGGAKLITPKKNNKTSPRLFKQDDPRQVSHRVKKITIVVSTALTSCLLWVYRDSWLGLFNKEKLLETTLKALHHLDSQPKYISYSVYVLGMAVWEALGLSTIPVETASGMVFGWTGFYLSAIGKIMGAVVAFCLARYGILAAFIQEKLSSNQVLKLLAESAKSNPLRVAFFIKLSCFPETIKNYGSSLLQPIRLWMFIFATVTHGWIFSALWTYLGVDTAIRLKDSSIPVDSMLQILLTIAIVNGVVVSPLSMGFWIKSLKKPTQLLPKSDKKQGPSSPRLKK